MKDIWGRSIGKQLMKIKVVNFHDCFSKVSVWKLILRNIASPIWVVDVILVLYIGKKQKLMDAALDLDVVSCTNRL